MKQSKNLSPWKKPTLLLICLVIQCSSCTQRSSNGEVVTDTTSTESTSAPEDFPATDGEDADDPGGGRIIGYEGTAKNDVRKELENFSPLTPVLSAASQCIAIKDSLEMVRRNADGNYVDKLTDPADSVVFRPLEIKAWQAIQEYKTWVAAGPSLKEQCPSLLAVDRVVSPEDKSAARLPEAGQSQFLSHGKFFFLGGAPFITEVMRDDGTPFMNAQGKPEKHYASILNENGNYLLNSVYHFDSPRMNVTFGEPLRSYDEGPQEVNGVGSLIHEFLDPVFVFFLTENGVVPAKLISATVKLVPENLGCVSDHPKYIFACEKNIDATEILAIYVAYHSAPVTSFKITRLANDTWTADLNEDGIADLACVQSSSIGEASGETIAEALWFVNVDGTWQIIDYATDLDCT